MYGLAANIAVPLQQKYGALPVLLRAQLAALIVVIPFGLSDLNESTWSWAAAAAMVPLGALGTGLAFVLMATLVGRVGGASRLGRDLLRSPRCHRAGSGPAARDHRDPGPVRNRAGTGWSVDDLAPRALATTAKTLTGGAAGLEPATGGSASPSGGVISRRRIAAGGSRRRRRPKARSRRSSIAGERGESDLP